MGISYRRAWEKIHESEDRLGIKLVETQTGGEGGGGSYLTPAATDYIQRFHNFTSGLKNLVTQRFQETFPGIEVPYVSAIVDLEGGGTVKGNLINVDPNPESVKMGMPVEVVYQIAPRKDAEGNEYLTYYFQPRS